MWEGAASPHCLQQSGHSQSHQGHDFLLGEDYKDRVDKTIHYLSISMLRVHLMALYNFLKGGHDGGGCGGGVCQFPRPSNKQ